MALMKAVVYATNKEEMTDRTNELLEHDLLDLYSNATRYLENVMDIRNHGH